MSTTAHCSYLFCTLQPQAASRTRPCVSTCLRQLWLCETWCAFQSALLSWHCCFCSSPLPARATVLAAQLLNGLVCGGGQVEQAQLAHLCTVMSGMHHRRAGYPFGTLTDFASDGAGFPVFCLSPLAIHTRNIIEDPRCSLVVQLPGWTGLANARVTIFGDVFQLPPELQESAKEVFLQKQARSPFRPALPERTPAGAHPVVQRSAAWYTLLSAGPCCRQPRGSGGSAAISLSSGCTASPTSTSLAALGQCSGWTWPSMRLSSLIRSPWLSRTTR